VVEAVSTTRLTARVAPVAGSGTEDPQEPQSRIEASVWATPIPGPSSDTIVFLELCESLAADTALLERALWRSHSRLAPHWLHALRGMLNAISLNAMLVGNALARLPATDDQRRSARAIQEQVKGLDRGLNRLLDPELEGSIDDDGTRVNLGAVLAEVAELLRPAAKKKGVSVVVTAPDAGAWVSAPRVLVHQVVTALATESLDRASSASTLALDVRQGPTGSVLMEVSYPQVDSRALDDRVAQRGQVAESPPALVATLRMASTLGARIDYLPAPPHVAFVFPAPPVA
jgi:signal transduction histidine kinase